MVEYMLAISPAVHLGQSEICQRYGRDILVAVVVVGGKRGKVTRDFADHLRTDHRHPF